MKTFSTKSNAKRAAKKLGDTAVVEQAEGGWAIFEDAHDLEMFNQFGTVNCPNEDCKVNLNNGVWTNDAQVAEGKKALSHEFWCLGCDTGFGELIVATPASTAPKGTGLKIEKDRPEQNGIKRPSVGGKTRAIWDACEEIYQATKQVPTAAEMKVIALAKGWNLTTLSIQSGQWRKFNGLSPARKK